MTLHSHLQIVGVSQIALALAHTTFTRRFNWKEETARLSPLNRQIFYVHTVFLCVVLTLFGLLSLFCANELLAPSRLAAFVLAGLTFFWTLRWLFQFFVYDSRLWKGNRFNMNVHIIFSAVWTYFGCVYGAALWNQINL
jgi:cation transport ATPase